MHVNHEFVLAFAAAQRGKILDYGCGGGEVVSEGLNRGLDIWGTDVFYAGGPAAHGAAEATGLLDSRILHLKEGRIPFSDHTFDLVFHNQVFEHVPDIDRVLSEIARVLRPSGVMLSLFPSKEVWREGHCGVMFAHRLQSETWLRLWRSLGVGKHHDSKSVESWSKDFKQWLNAWCYYRDESVIRKSYEAAGFSFVHREIDYICFRLNLTGKARFIKMAQQCQPVAEYLYKRLGGMVLVSTKNSRINPLDIAVGLTTT